MPIGPFEREVLRLLASNRNPESFVGRATVVLQSQDSPSRSEDIDLFHDTTESLRQAVDQDCATLRAAGYICEFTVQQNTFIRASVSRGQNATKLEWVFDSAFRFFPVERDEDLGWRLNFWDAATNKLLALAGRSVFRDYFDVIYLHERHLALGALAWAAAAKDPGLTPEMIIEQSRRNSRYPGEDISKLGIALPVDLRAMKKVLLDAAESAEQLFERLPPAEMGCFYLDASGQSVCPDPNSAEFPNLTRHFGCVKGAWPRVVEQ